MLRAVSNMGRATRIASTLWQARAAYTITRANAHQVQLLADPKSTDAVSFFRFQELARRFPDLAPVWTVSSLEELRSARTFILECGGDISICVKREETMHPGSPSVFVAGEQYDLSKDGVLEEASLAYSKEVQEDPNFRNGCVPLQGGTRAAPERPMEDKTLDTEYEDAYERSGSDFASASDLVLAGRECPDTFLRNATYTYTVDYGEGDDRNFVCISDSGHHRILLVDMSGEIFDCIGSGVLGLGDGSFDVSRFNYPRGVTFCHKTNEVVVCDTANHCIRLAHMDTRTVRTMFTSPVNEDTGIMAKIRRWAMSEWERQPSSWDGYWPEMLNDSMPEAVMPATESFREDGRDWVFWPEQTWMDGTTLYIADGCRSGTWEVSLPTKNGARPRRIDGKAEPPRAESEYTISKQWPSHALEAADGSIVKLTGLAHAGLPARRVFRSRNFAACLRSMRAGPKGHGRVLVEDVVMMRAGRGVISANLHFPVGWSPYEPVELWSMNVEGCGVRTDDRPEIERVYSATSAEADWFGHEDDIRSAAAAERAKVVPLMRSDVTGGPLSIVVETSPGTMEIVLDVSAFLQCQDGGSVVCDRVFVEIPIRVVEGLDDTHANVGFDVAFSAASPILVDAGFVSPDERGLRTPMPY